MGSEILVLPSGRRRILPCCAFTMMMKLAFILSAAALATVVYSDKDTNFYHDGFTNPNIENEMYWKDSVNVLQDLSQFSALYIKHHGCV